MEEVLGSDHDFLVILFYLVEGDPPKVPQQNL